MQRIQVGTSRSGVAVWHHLHEITTGLQRSLRRNLAACDPARYHALAKIFENL
jgi:hypothetical protein